MDKLPKFRRKPKPPAIETGVARANQTHMSANNIVTTSPHIITNPGSSSGLQQTVVDTGKIRHTHSGMTSPFRSLRMRNSAKRARDSSPADSVTSSPPVLQHISGSGGVKVLKSDHVTHHSRWDRPRRSYAPLRLDTEIMTHTSSSQTPKMPDFLNLSDKEIENKYNDLVWKERNRAAGPDWRYKFTETKETVMMDRYANIKPWNHNRVKLRVPQDQLDYVNASTITLDSPSGSSEGPLRYIAMQGPTEPSFPFVWRMIAEQVKSPEVVIVQLTSFFEGIQIKCHQYFPDGEEDSVWELNENDIWGDQWKATLTYDSSEKLLGDAIEKRKLLLHVHGEERPKIIWHFLYEQWPDFGTPTLDDMAGFFELMKISRDYSSPDGPRIVHCSAGVGRTGTLITLEHLIRELEAGRLGNTASTWNIQSGVQSQRAPDQIYNTVDLLREQRRGMVQGTIQFKFIYQVMRKLWQDKYGTADGDEDDEDMTDGGAAIPTSTTSETPPSISHVNDPFYDTNREDDEDQDEGGVKVKPVTTRG